MKPGDDYHTEEGLAEQRLNLFSWDSFLEVNKKLFDVFSIMGFIEGIRFAVHYLVHVFLFRSVRWYRLLADNLSRVHHL